MLQPIMNLQLKSTHPDEEQGYRPNIYQILNSDILVDQVLNLSIDGQLWKCVISSKRHMPLLKSF